MQASPTLGPAPAPTTWYVVTRGLRTVPWYLHAATAYVAAVFVLLLVALLRAAS